MLTHPCLSRLRHQLLASFLTATVLGACLLVAATVNRVEAEEQSWRVVNYWSEWCAPCRVEIPMLNQLSADLSESQVLVEGVNFDEDPRNVTLDIAADLGIKFTTLTQAQVESLGLRPPDVLPTTYILAPDNSQAAKLIGMQTREQILEQLEQLGVSLNLEE